jgi:fatty acid desaturase
VSRSTIATAGSIESLRSDLRAAGVFEPATRYYVALGTTLGGAHVLAYATLLCDPGAGLRAVAWLVTIFTSVQLALLAHDAAHGAIAGKRWQRELIGHLGMSFVNGYSFAYFTATHMAHHAHPNDPARDPDMRPEVFSVYAPWPAEKRGVSRIVRRYQAWLLPFGLLLWVFALRGNGVAHSLRHRPATRTDLVAIGLHAAVWLAIPVSLLGFAAALVNYCFVAGLTGFYLGTLFIPNHVGMPIISEGSVVPQNSTGCENSACDYVIRQAATSRNFGGSRLVAFLAGGLDSQIEHHLFPQVPNVRLRRARAVVRDFCARYRVPYREGSYIETWREVLAQFDRVGQTAALSARDRGVARDTFPARHDERSLPHGTSAVAVRRR